MSALCLSLSEISIIQFYSLSHGKCYSSFLPLPHCCQTAMDWVHQPLPACRHWGLLKTMDDAEGRPMTPTLLRLQSKLLVRSDGGKCGLRLGLAQLCGDSRALWQLLLLVHHMVSDTNPQALHFREQWGHCWRGHHRRGHHAQAAQAPGAQAHQAYESMCHQTPYSQRNTPGLQQARQREMMPYCFLLLHQATTWSFSDQHWRQRAALKVLMLPLAWGERVTHVVLRFFGCNVISWLLRIYLCSFVHTPAHSPHRVAIDQANGRDPIAHAPTCSPQPCQCWPSQSMLRCPRKFPII